MEWSDKRPFERDLDSGWRIALDPGNTGKRDGWMNAVRPEAVPAVVPGNISDSIDTFTRGVAWYWIRFSLDGPVPGDLEYALKAGYTEWVAEYWLNGVFAGSFTGTRLNYEFDVTGAVRPGENLLAVRIVSPTSGGIDGWQFGGEFQEVRDNAVIYTPCNIVTSARNVNSAYGGIRYPVADCPTASYQSYTERADGSIQMMFGTAKPFSGTLLREMYGSLAHYRALAEQSTDRAVAKGFILPEDREYMIESVTAIAKERGLR